MHLAAFNRADHWARRRFGEPSVLDEDVAGALVARARLEPEDCFGLPRLLQVRATDTEDSKFWDAHVEGILAFAAQAAAAAQEQLLAEAPLALAMAPPFHVEVLDWESVAAWVAPSRHTPPRTPSPLPHLPSSWEEPTDAYLDSPPAAAARHRVPPAAVVPLRGLRHVQPARSDAAFPQLFNRRERPQLGPYCGIAED